MMIKFFDIDSTDTTQYLYNGDKGYIHKFSGEQSTKLIYTHTIYAVSDIETLNISIEPNNIFSLLDISNLGNLNEINGFEYYSLDNSELKVNKLILTGKAVGDKYIFAIPFMATSNMAGEFIAEWYIENNTYSIGADFYNEDETLKINLANFGIEIPNSIQKALYNTNVHEDEIDNILLNRKWRELLTNYWDIIANKGSYKSLINSLKWFEYGDKVKIKEYWGHEGFNKTILDSRPLNSLITDKYEEFVKIHYKTSYISLYYALQEFTGEYDSECNPKVQAMAQEFTINDLALKMSMLGNFYETYFMPIHLDLIQSTLENIVFTNIFKIINTPIYTREDSINCFLPFSCNVQADDVFNLKDIEAYITTDLTWTPTNYNQGGEDWIKFSKNYITYYNEKDYQEGGEPVSYDNMVQIIGVNDIEPNLVMNDKNIKPFYSQLYKGPGAIIKTICSAQLEPGDYIKRETISFLPDDDLNDYWVTKEFRDIYKPNINNIVEIPLNLLCRQARNYEYRIIFETANSKSYVGKIKFKVEDSANYSLNIYKIQKQEYTGFNEFTSMEYNKNINLYNFGRQMEFPIDAPAASFFVPVYVGEFDNLEWKGICLNNILIIKSPNQHYIFSDTTIVDNEVNKLKTYLDDNYFLFTKKTSTNIYYTIGVSKQFWFKPDLEFIKPITESQGDKIFRNDYGYFPEFHKLIKFGGTKFEDNVITSNDTLCVIPDIPYGAKIKEDSIEWVFENVSTGQIINYKGTIKEPFVTNNEKYDLPAGFYNIIFKYSLTNEAGEHTLEIDSAFFKR